MRSYSLDDQCEKLALESNEAAKKLSKMTTAEMKARMMAIEKELRRTSDGA